MTKTKPFDINQWIYATPETQIDHKFNLGGAEIQIRRLNGLEWQEAVVNEKEGKFLFTLLKYGLINPATNEPFTETLVTEFCRKRPIAVTRIALEIQELTLQTMQAEVDILETAEKNFGETGESEPPANGADSTVKTQ